MMMQAEVGLCSTDYDISQQYPGISALAQLHTVHSTAPRIKSCDYVDRAFDGIHGLKIIGKNPKYLKGPLYRTQVSLGCGLCVLISVYN